MLIPPKLKPGDGVRVIAPSCSMRSIRWLTPEFLRKAEKRFESLGLKVSYAQHINEMDAFDSSSIEHRLKDFHNAFADPTVHLIDCIRGGFSGNQLLQHIDYELIRSHPKIFCGFSDITVLQNAIYAKTGLITYSGPSFYAFGYDREFAYTFDYFQKCLLQDQPFDVQPSPEWTDDRWSPEKLDLHFTKNDGYWILQNGKAEGTLLGGNLCTLNLLQGTSFMPDLTDSILFIEDDHESQPCHIDRNLQSLLHMSSFTGVCGLVFGRFEPKSGMTRELFEQIIRTKKELRGLPIIANADFGHTQPMITFPIGGTVRIDAHDETGTITILEH